MPQMKGGIAEGRVKAAAKSPRAGRSVRKSSRVSGAPRLKASAEAPREIFTVLSSAARPSSSKAAEMAPGARKARATRSNTGPTAKRSTGKSTAAEAARLPLPPGEGGGEG